MGLTNVVYMCCEEEDLGMGSAMPVGKVSGLKNIKIITEEKATCRLHIKTSNKNPCWMTGVTSLSLNIGQAL